MPCHSQGTTSVLQVLFARQDFGQNAAINLGHEYLAITDHSQGLRIARGLSPRRMARQRQTIRRTSSDVG
jgi:histidinol phosphatase-like PHP family hydrolase